MTVGSGSAPRARFVAKRNGAVAAFDAGKIRSAIERAGRATGEFDAARAAELTAQALKVIDHRFAGRTPGIEDIQDIVEQALVSADCFATARAYIVYREKRGQARADHKTVVDVASSINEYLQRSDWRISICPTHGYLAGEHEFCPLCDAERLAAKIAAE